MQATPDEGQWNVWKYSDNFGKFIHQFQPETKTLVKKFNKII